jgi:NPCBM/NEW2 domain-containing protein
VERASVSFRKVFGAVLSPTHVAFWTLLASLVTVIAFLLSSDVLSFSGGSTVAAAASPSAKSAPASVPRVGGTSATPTTPASSPSKTAANQIRLYTLPGNAAGQLGRQREAFDATLAGQRYPESTGIWVQCSSQPSVMVTFYVGGTYQKLSAIAGVADLAPPDMTVTIQVYADGGLWKWFGVTRDQSLPIDLDIGGYKTIGLTASTPARCPSSTKPLAYLGDAVVY